MLDRDHVLGGNVDAGVLRFAQKDGHVLRGNDAAGAALGLGHPPTLDRRNVQVTDNGDPRKAA